MTSRLENYTLEQAEEEIADLRQQITAMAETFTFTDITDPTSPPTIPSAGEILFSDTGRLKYGSSADSNDYFTGYMTYPATGSLTLGTSMATVPGLSAPLGVGAYRVRALLCTDPNGAGGQLHFRMHPTGGLTASNGRTAFYELLGTNQVPLTAFNVLDTTFDTSTPGGAGASRIDIFDGYFVISVAGTLNVQAFQTATANTIIRQYGSYLDVFPAPST